MAAGGPKCTQESGDWYQLRHANKHKHMLVCLVRESDIDVSHFHSEALLTGWRGGRGGNCVSCCCPLANSHGQIRTTHERNTCFYFYMYIYLCIFYIFTLVYTYIYIYIYIYLCGKLLASDDVERNVMDDVGWVGKERFYISSLFCEQKVSIKIESGRLDKMFICRCIIDCRCWGLPKRCEWVNSLFIL